MPQLQKPRAWHGLEFFLPCDDVKDLQVQWHSLSIFQCLRGGDADNLSVNEKAALKKNFAKVQKSIKDVHNLFWPGRQVPIMVPASHPRPDPSVTRPILKPLQSECEKIASFSLLEDC